MPYDCWREGLQLRVDIGERRKGKLIFLMCVCMLLFVSFEHSFFFVSCFDPDVVITPAHIELGEDVGVLYLTD